MRISLSIFMLTLALACTGVQAQSTFPDTEAKLKTMLGAADDYTLEYRDLKGAKLSFEEFLKQRTSTFSMHKDPATHTMTLSLADKNTQRAASPAMAKVKAGETLPAFKLTSLAGREIDSKALLGKATLLNFFYAECAPCIKEIPDLNSVAAKRTDMHYAAITYDAPEKAQQFVDENKLSWPVLAGNRAYINQLGVNGYPTFILLDAQGVVLGVKSGLMMNATRNTLEDWVETLLPAKKIL